MSQRTHEELDDLQRQLPGTDAFRVPYELLQEIMLHYERDEWQVVTRGGNTARAYRSTGADHDFVLFTVNERED